MENETTSIENYEPLSGLATPCFSYIDGDEKEKFWYDSLTFFFIHDFEDGDLIDGKKYWCIEPHKPKGFEMTKKNLENAPSDPIKWFVTFSSVDEDVDKLWNFEKHTVYTF